jgi:hypothetical protein
VVGLIGNKEIFGFLASSASIVTVPVGMDDGCGWRKKGSIKKWLTKSC